ncbi:uncharacterized protein K02A2.6-like [Thamnophis elegans]|uniref:uncharacterized protein K02A2.6-like n=1 Tax=Thamnophis elegans TaxID=35005 RepID=UPI0013777A7D|nr:uncharacterized protein K02A2.6-like [Thamnophis elegans]
MVEDDLAYEDPEEEVVAQMRTVPKRKPKSQPAAQQASAVPCRGCGGRHKRQACPFLNAICNRDLPALLGLDWFPALGLSIGGVHRVVPSTLEDTLREFSDVFDGQLGRYKGTPISLSLDPQVAPIRLKARRVPFALRAKVDAELDKLLAQGVIEPVDHSPWETPIVLPIKPDGSVRICADYKSTINLALQANPYPVPVVQHLLHSLGQGCTFAKLDMAQAYQQLPVDDDAAAAQTIVTHRGAFRCRRLQFGVSVAPGIFQSLMERLLHGLPGVVPYFDDVLIAASSRSELIEVLRKVLSHHKPLLGLLAGDKPTPPILSPRMTRWTEFLAAYSYTLQYRPGKQLGHADALSRCPLPETDTALVPCLSVLSIASSGLPISAADVAACTKADPILSQVASWVSRGWPLDKVAEGFKPFKIRQAELSLHGGCLIWGDRVVIPTALRPQVLSLLHKDHPGIARMKALARSYVWWPLLDSEIAAYVGRCNPCQQSRPNPPAGPAREWEAPRGPWSRLHLDFAGPFHCQSFLVVVDAYSRWVELVLMGSTTAESTVRALRRLFATHGLPDLIVSDNGPQFMSTTFQEFLAMQGIRHAPIAPYHPASNGRAERAVRSAKEALGRMRRLRTPLDRLHPLYSGDQPSNLGVIPPRSFKLGDAVWARAFSGPARWVPATVTALTGPCSFRVGLADGSQWRRHLDQLRRRLPPPASSPDPTDAGAACPGNQREAFATPGLSCQQPRTQSGENTPWAFATPGPTCPSAPCRELPQSSQTATEQTPPRPRFLPPDTPSKHDTITADTPPRPYSPVQLSPPSGPSQEGVPWSYTPFREELPREILF